MFWTSSWLYVFWKCRQSKFSSFKKLTKTSHKKTIHESSSLIQVCWRDTVTSCIEQTNLGFSSHRNIDQHRKICSKGSWNVFAWHAGIGGLVLRVKRSQFLLLSHKTKPFRGTLEALSDFEDIKHTAVNVIMNRIMKMSIYSQSCTVFRWNADRQFRVKDGKPQKPVWLLILTNTGN